MPTERRLAARLQRTPISRRAVYAGGRRRALRIADELLPLLDGGGPLLDIGSGTCNLAEVLGERGLRVTPLDVADYSFVDGLRPLLYPGGRLPFADDAFGVALLGAVLHHVPNPGILVDEARRVAPRVVVMEDLHRGPVHRVACSVVDSLLSLEFDFPSHGYRREAAWRRLFEQAGLQVVETRRWRSMGGLFRHVAFQLERPADQPNR
jgi:SAM-dependent methyltransferase